MIGRILGNYQITELIGAGGMGTVYRGFDLMLEREVAIKALRAELMREPQIMERFRAEAVSLARLNHPCITTLHSFLRFGDECFMVMEFVQGQTLETFLRQQGVLTAAAAVPLILQILLGLEHAHQQGVIHRDLKPANLMVTQEGRIKLMDFGIARVLGTSRLTRAGRLIGTIEYMSPEQICGQEGDARSDIYTLGLLCYEMLTGRVPFSSNSEYDLMRAQVELPPPPLHHFIAAVDTRLEQTILHALAKNPSDRFQTTQEFRAALLATAAVSNAAAGEVLQPKIEVQPVAEIPLRATRWVSHEQGKEAIAPLVATPSATLHKRHASSTILARWWNRPSRFIARATKHPLVRQLHGRGGASLAVGLMVFVSGLIFLRGPRAPAPNPSSVAPTPVFVPATRQPLPTSAERAPTALPSATAPLREGNGSSAQDRLLSKSEDKPEVAPVRKSRRGKGPNREAEVQEVLDEIHRIRQGNP
jgi:serine/threonine-protein kinase